MSEILGSNLAYPAVWRPGIVRGENTLAHRVRSPKNTNKQTAVYMRIGAKVIPSDVREPELPPLVMWLAVPPVALSRLDPTRGSFGSF